MAKKSNRFTKFQKLTFTKRLVTIVLIVSLIDVQLTYVLAFLNREIAETLGVAIVTEIIAVTVTYAAKAFFENKEEHKHKLEEDKFKYFSNIEEDESNDIEEFSP